MPRLQAALIAVAVAVAVLSGCAAPRLPGLSSLGSDGPGERPVAELLQVPDAEPRVEPIRNGGANKPYEIAGRRYYPQAADVPLRERALASWYGRKYHGRPTSIGEAYDMYAMTAAHPTMPLPSYARVRNPANGREIIVRVNDRGPFHPGRVIDLSYAAAARLELLRGVAPVDVERLTHDDIRSGAWLRGREAAAPVTASVAPVAGGAAVAQPRAEDRPARDAATSSPRPAAAVMRAADDTDAGRTAARDGGVPAPGHWMQLGAFRDRDGAERLREQVANAAEWLAPLLAVFEEQSLHRVQAGPYASREEVRQAAERARETLLLAPLLVERR